MKRGTPDHPKTHELAEALGVPIYAAVGILEMLWHFGAKYSPRGDVGRYSDRAIGRACDFDDGVRLVDALVVSGWLDRCDENRLVLHNWSEHCDDYVKKQLSRDGKSFVSVMSGKVQTIPDKKFQECDSFGTARHGMASVVNQNSETRASEATSIEPSVGPIIEELESIYRQAGAPIPEPHKQLAIQLLISIPPEKRARVPNYCKWALVSGKWPSPAKTKALLNVLRDGDWDVEITPRVLPQAREPSAREAAHERAAEKFRRME